MQIKSVAVSGVHETRELVTAVEKTAAGGGKATGKFCPQPPLAQGDKAATVVRYTKNAGSGSRRRSAPSDTETKHACSRRAPGLRSSGRTPRMPALNGSACGSVTQPVSYRDRAVRPEEDEEMSEDEAALFAFEEVHIFTTFTAPTQVSSPLVRRAQGARACACCAGC